ncbi:MAG: ABC transporter [Alphaproteobacteria bacterium]|nr:ABC transporter [Alphaproteobacteria bacterium]
MTLDALSHNRRLIAALSLTVAVVLFIALNIAATSFFRTARVDLTDKGLFTVSAGTQEILSNLKEPVTLRFFFSRRVAADYAQIQAYGERVRDLLREYQSIAGDKLRVEEIDPEPFSEEEDRALALGITAAPTREGKTIYFGVVGSNSIDGQEVLAYLNQDREQYLEYDLTSLIARLDAEKKPKLGLITNLPLDTGPGGLMAAMQGRSQPYMIYEQITQSFDVVFLEQEFKTISPDIDTLLIAHPKALAPHTLYAIDQFVMRGGRVLAFVDPISEISQTASESGNPLAGSTFSSDLGPLLKAWGIDYDPNLVVADRLRAQRVQYGRTGGQIIDYILWLGLQEADFDRDDIVTSALQVLNLGTPGALKQAEGATTTFVPLVRSSAEAMTMPADDVRGQSDPPSLLARFLPTGERYVIAARISGPVKSAYPDGPPAEPAAAPEEGAEEETAESSEALPAHLPESANPANIIVMADSDIFDDRFWVQVQQFLGQRMAVPIADNAAFVLNAAENLLGSSALISLRTRASSTRPFAVVDELRRRAETRYLAEQQRLEAKLDETQSRIDALQRTARPDGASGAVLTPEQEAEIDRFLKERAATRGELRTVQRELTREIESLGTMLAIINIALVPIVVAGVAIALAVLRSRRRHQRVAEGTGGG